MSIVYKYLVKTVDKFVPAKLQPLWNHPAGPKTIFFWAPTWKWGIVLAGIGDFFRPVEKLSISQSTSLFATGIIWSRYSVVIVPINYNLLSVNMFVALTQLVQLSRIFMHRQSQK